MHGRAWLTSSTAFYVQFKIYATLWQSRILGEIMVYFIRKLNIQNHFIDVNISQRDLSHGAQQIAAFVLFVCETYLWYLTEPRDWCHFQHNSMDLKNERYIMNFVLPVCLWFRTTTVFHTVIANWMTSFKRPTKPAKIPRHSRHCSLLFHYHTSIHLIIMSIHVLNPAQQLHPT